MMRNSRMSDQELKEFRSILREAARYIDPVKAEVEWTYGQILDPYGIAPDLREEYQKVGRNYFARSPGSEICVWFGDLPEATRAALWQRHKQKLAFPAGHAAPAARDDVWAAADITAGPRSEATGPRW